MTSLVQLVRRRALETPELALYTFLADDGQAVETLDAAGLARRTDALARLLAARAGPGERALLLFPPGLEFVVAFFACLTAGVVAVPSSPPGRRRGRERLAAIARDAEPSLLVTTESFAGRAAAWVDEIPGLGACRVITSDGSGQARGSAHDGELRLPPPPEGDDLAFLQYTSGSTSTPKGVRVLHRNLIDNEEAIRRAFGQSRDSVVASWLPLYHDMGLIGGVLQPLFVGARCVLMAPAAFLKRPALWLETIHRHRATTSGGPDFAYALVAERVAPDLEVDGEPLDLSSWRVAFDGSEPVRAATLGRFAGTFAPAGFDPRAFQPCYGLAEATLFVTGGELDQAPRVLDADAAALERGVWRPARPDARATTLVSCGRPRGQHRVQVVDPESRRPVAAGTVGEIWVHGASVADGYHRAVEATAETFAARWVGAEDGEVPAAPWLRTGDLGFFVPAVDEPELVITGRLKDLVVLRGRNLYPHDVELAVERALPVRPGAVAAFAAPAAEGAVDGERLVVVAELDRSADPSSIDRLTERARQVVAEAQEAPLSELVLIRPTTLPRTSSGKVRRRETRRRYLAEELTVVARSGGSSDGGEVADGDDPGDDDRPGDLRSLVARLVGVPADALGADRPLVALGLDSLGAVELAGALETWGLGRFDGARLLDGVTLAELEAGRLAPGDDVRMGGPPREVADPGRATAGEAAFVLRQRLVPEASPDALAVAFRLERPWDRDLLESALVRLARRHPALATTFEESDDGTVRRRLVEGLAPRVTWHDEPLGPDPEDAEDADDADDAERAERAALDRAAARPFDLARGPLLRLDVWPERLGGDGQLVLAVGHHAVLDHRSAEVLLGELGTLLAGGGLPPGPGTDEAAHARRLAAETGALEDAELDAAWRARLAGVAQELGLPTDRPRPASRRFVGGRVGATWPTELGEALVSRARETGATPFAVVLAAFSGLVGRLTGNDDLLVGVPASVRGAMDERAVGYLVDVVPVRARLAGASFADLVERTRRGLTEALAGAALPFPVLAARLAPGEERRRPPLVQALAVLHRAGGSTAVEGEPVSALALGASGVAFELGGVPARSVAVTPPGAPVDLTLSVAAPAAGSSAPWRVALQFDRDLFDRSTAQALLDRLERLLAAGLARPGQAVDRLPLLAPAERRALVTDGGETAACGPVGASIPERFFRRAAEHPDAPALHDRRGAVTYGELSARAEGVARRLVARGVRPGDRVAVSLPRDRDLVATLLGVMAARAVSAPVDPAYPAARRRAMERAAGARMVLDEAGLAELLAHRVDGAAPLPSPEPGDLAYLIFTSGSTGVPKAVAIEHRSAAALMDWAHRRFGDGDRDDLAVVLASTSVSFDLSVFELFAPLTLGGEVVLLRDALELTEGGVPAASSRGTLWSGVPSAAAELVRSGALPPGLGTAALAGEALPAELVGRLAEAGIARISNLYGPSEDTTYSTEWHWRSGDEPPTRPPIGRPLPGGRALVLDRHLEPVPVGVVGELVLGGSGLARGYLGDPRATAEAFVPDPFAAERDEAGARLYRTGDLARRLPGGELDFLGRRDRQVKVRGFRVEPGEIESVLATHPAVAEAAVAAVGELGDRRLVAWVVPADGDGDLDVAELLEHAARRLARPLVPSTIVTLAALPRTPNGKLDATALPLPPVDEGGGDEALLDPPRGPLEERLAGIWRDLLELPAEAPLSRGDDFFRRGGHSLLAGRLVARVRRELGVELELSVVFDRPTLAGLGEAVEAARQRAGGDATSPPLVAAGPDAGEAPLSPTQARLWFLDRLAPDAALYVLPGLLELSGPLEPVRLATALGALVGRQPSLRTRFAQPPGAAEPVQRVDAPPGVLPLPVVDLSRLPTTAARTAERRAALALARRPFDLTVRPGLRAALVRRRPGRHALSLTVHHAVADGWSLGVMLRELAALYRGETLAPLPVTPGDVARWQRRFLEGPAAEAQLDAWRSHLDGLPPSLPLPTDRPRPAVRRGRGLLVPVPWPAETAAAVGALARRLETTPFTVVLAAFEAFLARLSGEDDFAVAVPVAGRRPLGGEMDSLVACLVNTLAVRARLRLHENPGFVDLVATARTALVGALERQDVPFDRVVEAVGASRDRSRTPLAQVMLADQEVTGAPSPPGAAWPGLDARLVPVHPGSAKVDLTLAPGGVGPDGRGGDGWLEVDRDLFDPATAHRLARRFVTFLRSALDQPERPVVALDLLDGAERREVAACARGVPLERPVGWTASTLHGLVLDGARRHPAAVAVVDDGTGESLTYDQLDRRSARLAGTLARRGVEPGDRVAVLAQRCPGMVVALLGILRAGAAYLPLDPEAPASRTAELVDDAGIRVVVTAGLEPGPPPAGVLVLPADRGGDDVGGPGPARDPDAPELPAYVLYTSGSTGRPKGVVNAHRGPVRRLLWGQTLFPLGPGDRVLQKTPLTFDVSVYELFHPLAAGARLVLARPGGHRDGRYLAELLARREITLAHFVPSMLRLFLDTPEPSPLPALRTVLASGEALTDDDARRAADRFGGGTDLWNLYGPTEAAIEVSAGRAVAAGAPVDRVTLGRAAPGCRLRVVDRQLGPAGFGVVGELVLGGPQVAAGYLGRPAPTARAFVPDPWSQEPGARLYRTGDRVRLLADGRFDYLGRLDSQLKVRGVRVEAGEVEAALVALDGVAQAAVTVVDDRVVAYLVGEPGDGGASVPPVEDLRAGLRDALPPGLVPGQFVSLPGLPRLASGKVDRRRLPPPPPLSGTTATGRTPFDTPTEREVGDVWREALGIDGIGADDDFFELGGHSLLASRILFAIEERLGVEVPLAELFDGPTVAGLAAAVDRHRSDGHRRPSGVGAEGSPTPGGSGGDRATHRPTPAQERLLFLEQLTPERSLYWMPAAVRLVGPLEPAAVAAALAALVARHEALRTVFVEVDGRTVASVRGAAEATARPATADLSDLAEPLATADRLASELASRPADLAAGPMVRCLLARLGDGDHLLVLAVHHIAADGWSLGLMVDELARDLAARTGEGEPPATPPLQYRAYARWLEERLESPELTRRLAAWTERLAGDPPILAPLADRPEAARRTGRRHRGGTVPVAVAPETVAALDRLARERGASPFAVSLAAWGATLGRLAGEDDVWIASPVANRPRAELARVVGLFANTVVLRLAVDPDATGSCLVSGAQGVIVDALAGAEVPFERLVAALAPERRLGAHPLAQVMLALQDEPPPVPVLPGVAVHRRPVRSGAAKLDLTLDLERRDGSLVGELELDLDLYDRATGERLATVWSTVLRALVAAPETPVAALPLLSDAARRAILASGGEPGGEPAGGFEALPSLWRRRAAERPEAVAVVAGDESVTYGRLAARAAVVAAALGRRLGPADTEPRIGVVWASGAPGIDLLVCLWGALDAGAAYVPLDPSLPAARRAEILEDSGVRLVVGSRAAVSALPDEPDVERLALEEIADRAPEPRWREIHPATAAYVLFTSGSTGRPKGVVVPHGALAVHARSVGEAFGLTADDRVLRTASPAFDVLVEEVFPTWSVGGAVVGPAAGARPVVPEELGRRLAELGVTVANLPGSLWHGWVAGRSPDDAWPESLRLVVVGSEAVSPAAARRWWELGGPPLVNAYGLTEATVTSLLGPVDTPPLEGAPRLSVGRPLPGVTAHVVDRRGRLLPDGAPGELRLGGGALARGYLERPAETAAVFLPDPFSPHPGARLLATGDRARRDRDGAIEILGRLDDQVKVRGVRIEPGEVESALAAVAGVADAAVVAAGSGAVRRLVGFWAPRAGARHGELPAEEDLLAQVARRLPRDLVPARLVRLERLPTTASGKVDRRRLARQADDLETASAGSGGGAGNRPSTPAEELVAVVLGELLERSDLTPESDFFELGGHSLLAGQAASRLGDVLGVPVRVADLFECPTVAGLARRAEERRAGGGGPVREPVVATPAAAGPHPLSPSQERFWLLERLAPGSARYAIPAALDLDGPLDLAALARALGTLVERHEVLRSRFTLGESGPVQWVVALDGPLALPVVDVCGLPEDVAEAEVRRLAAVLARRGFDLETPPHLAASVLRRGWGSAARHRLVLSVHHIAADGWSIGLLVDELGASLAGREPPPPSLQFRDYARWQRRFLDGPAAEAQMDHWRQRLTPSIVRGAGAFELDGDRPRPPVESFRGASETFQLDPQLAVGLERLARGRGGTLFVGLAAVVGSLLARWTGVDGGVLGTPVADRHAPETRDLVGPALNLLPVVVDASGDGLGLDGLLERLAPRWLDDYAHRDLPFERLVDELVPARDLARAPLFQILLVLQNAALGELDLGDARATPVPVATGAARYDLALSFDRAGGGLELTVERSTALYDATTVARLVRSLETFWRAALEAPGRPLVDLPLLASAEAHQVLREWQGGALAHPRPTTVPEQLAEQIRRTPDRPALTVPGTGAEAEVAWTYRQLGQRAAALARRLEGHGVGRGDLVTVALPRSAQMVLALLAVMETGAAYLPLDPDYPAGRLERIVADARPVLALVAPGSAAPGGVPALELSARELDGPGGALGRCGPRARPVAVDGADLAYVLYTSGSTGQPKGVVVTHDNATAFFAAMDPVLGAPAGLVGPGDGEEPPATFLATTSISFDISVLELLWSLTRGVHLVVHPGSGVAGLLAASSSTADGTAARPATHAPAGPSLAPAGSPDLALLYFADDASGAPGRERYRLLLDGARRGDELGFSAVWTPERHFHAFGGLYPNPSVVAAALAATTERIALRAGSVVAPLHQPVRVAEEWSVVDNLSEGRVGISFASGWHPRDFTLAPGSFDGRKETLLDSVDLVRRLWRGERVELADGRGEPVEIEIHPRPVQAELPVWLTAAGNPETFRQAGERGAGVLTHLLAQSEDELAEKIALYRDASRRAGHGDGSVTLMLHTFVGDDGGAVRETVRGPLTAYLASSLDLVRGPAEEMGLDPDDLSDDDRRLLLDAAFERYYRGSGLFGTPREAAATLERMTALGVDEIGCLVDFGVGTDDALSGLGSLARLLPERSTAVARTGAAAGSRVDVSLAGLIERFGVTHLQSTPSLARLILSDPASRRALERLDHLVLGGEPLPVPLAEDLRAAVGPGTAIHDLYGPTETTVWSSAHRLASPVEPVGPSRSVSVGRPVLGEAVHLVDRRLRPVPPGVVGELAIAGTGVARGYLGRPAATAAAFVPEPLSGSFGERLYLTGDLGRHRPDGRLELLGRRDQQVKVGGHRIELGEIETTLTAHPAVSEAAVVAGPDGGLHAFLVAPAESGDGGEVARAERVPVLPRAVDEVRAGEILDGLARFQLPNGMEVAHLGDLHTRVGYEEIFENDSYFRHGLAVADGDTVLDVGANIGFFTLALHQRCRPGRVLAFEPIPATHRALAANVALYGLDAVETVHAGVGAVRETVTFTFYPGMDGLSGRYADPLADRAATRAIIVERMAAEGMALSDGDLEAFLDRQFESERHVCPVVPLGEVLAQRSIERIDLLKVDVERAEVDVLRGLGDAGWAAVRQAVLEVDTAENLAVVEEMLRERGFDVQTDELVTVDGGADRAGVEVWMVYASRDGLERQASPGPVNRQALAPLQAPVERPTRDELTAHLAERLPAAMVPGRIGWLDRLPRTPNGKVDRKSLAGRAARSEVSGTSVGAVDGPGAGGKAAGSGPPPATEAERAVAEVWKRVLGVPRVGRDDNFFEVGGNSLLLARVHGDLSDRFGREVPMLELFRKPTVASLAAFLGQEAPAERPAAPPDDRRAPAEEGADEAHESGDDSPADLPTTVERQRRFMAERRRRRNRR